MKLPEKNILLALGTITLLDVIILYIRNSIDSNSEYNFLLWNLFLGFLPFAFAYIILLFSSKITKVFFYLLCFIWLLFYPNAPYMITDFIHVEAKSTTVIYDTLIIFSISILSIFYGFYSLKIIYQLWASRFSHYAAVTAITAAIFLSSIGIYLGRILRLNSWDLFTHPWQVIKTTLDHLWPINENPETYYIILLFTFLQGIMLIMIHYLNFNQNKSYGK